MVGRRAGLPGGTVQHRCRGQIILGSIFAAYIGFAFDLPWFIHLPFAVLGAFVGGAIWGGIAGFLKAKTGAHEVITTIMLNWIAIYLVAWLLTKPAFLREGGSTRSVRR